MKQILVLNCSARVEGSSSRNLVEQLLLRLCKKYPGAKFTTRDLSRAPLPHVSAEFTSAIFVPPSQLPPPLRAALALSDTLVAELQSAEILVIGSPMYNYTVPSALKAWIDHIVRPGRTFSFAPDHYEGLLKNKKAYVVTASGGEYSHGPRMKEDFHAPYLKHILGFIGITDVTFIRAENLTLAKDAGLAAAEKTLEAISL